MQPTIQKLEVQFNMRLTTPDGPGYLVAKDEDGRLLVAVVQQPDKTHARCRHLWYWPQQIKELNQ